MTNKKQRIMDFFMNHIFLFILGGLVITSFVYVVVSYNTPTLTINIEFDETYSELIKWYKNNQIGQ